jgi:hypothetical protein
MSKEEPTKVPTVAEMAAMMKTEAQEWQATADRYKNALLGQRLILVDKSERAYTVMADNGIPRSMLKLPEPTLNGVAFMDKDGASAAKARLEKECPEFAPFEIHDFKLYAQEKAALHNRLSSQLEASLKPPPEHVTDVPSPAQLEAIENYRLKHGANWKEKLSEAWASGRDEREPKAALLRQVRNTFGPEWLQAYQPAPKSRTVKEDYGPSDLDIALNAKPEDATLVVAYEFPHGFSKEAESMYGWLRHEQFTPKWGATVAGKSHPGLSILLPPEEVPQLRIFQTTNPARWGNHPDVTKMLDEAQQASERMVNENRERLKKLTPDQREWIETIHQQTGLHLGDALDLNDKLHLLAAQHLKLCAIDLDTGLTSAQNNAQNVIERKVSELVEGVNGIKGAVFSHDARGTTVAVKFESGAANSLLEGGSYKVPVNPAYVKSLDGKKLDDALAVYADAPLKELIERLQESSVTNAPEVAEKLQTLTTVYAKLREIQSNNGFSDEQEEAKDQIKAEISQYVDQIDEIKGVELGSDPRYALVVLQFESGRSNHHGGGWSVPINDEMLETLDAGDEFWREHITPDASGLEPS